MRLKATWEKTTSCERTSVRQLHCPGTAAHACRCTPKSLKYPLLPAPPAISYMILEESSEDLLPAGVCILVMQKFGSCKRRPEVLPAGRLMTLCCRKSSYRRYIYQTCSGEKAITLLSNPHCAYPICSVYQCIL